MKESRPKILLPAVFAAVALALTVGVGAQMAPPAGHTPVASTPAAAPVAAPPMGMKMDCQAMMAKKQEMHDKRMAMDAALDTLVAEMNAAQGSKQADAMEKPMAAVINELVAQRKAAHAMKMEMEAAMMAHMMSHMRMGAMKGGMDCPMMKMGMASEPKADEKAPSN